MGYSDKEKQKEYQRNWVAKRRATWLLDKSCNNCGAKEELEIDHIDASQKVSHVIWSWAIARRDAELAKCQVLCKKCHLDKTNAFDRPKPAHGTGYMYSHFRCRCDQCKAWKKIDNANSRRKR